MAISVREQDDYSRFDYLVEFKLEQIRRYVAGLDQSIKESQIKTNELFKKEWPDEPLPSMAIEVLTQLEYHNPNLFYKSSLTVLYSFYESTAREITKFEGDKRRYKIKLNDLKGDGCHLFKDYLTKVMDINFSPLEDLWVKINRVRSIRNYIVHNESNSPGKRKHVMGICNSNPYLTFYPETNEIYISSSKYLTEFADNIEKFLAEFLNILRYENSMKSI